MATSKQIDRICLVILVITLLLTLCFLNGEALGITPIADGDEENGQFTANDMDGEWDASGATHITLSPEGVAVEGNGAYADDTGVHIVYAGKYILTGELENGSVVVDANRSDKVWVLLDGASVHCEDGAAFLVEQADKVFLTLAEGTKNVISSGAEYGEKAAASGIDGAVYSRDDLTVNGKGTLAVTAGYQHGIVCNDDFVIAGGTVQVTAKQDGIHANDSVRLTGMELTVSAGDDGITVSNDGQSDYVYIESGTLTIPSCYEGIEATDVTVAGGTVDIASSDDGINANSPDGSSVIQIDGGNLRIVNTGGRDADGLDSNGSIYITGGHTMVSVSDTGGNCALDYGSENGGVCEINGGSLVACGGSTMAEAISASSKQGFLMHRIASAAAGTAVTLKDESGEELLEEEIPCPFSLIVLSVPQLQAGETCTLLVGDAKETVTVGETVEAGAFGGMRMRGGMQMRPDGMQIAEDEAPARPGGGQLSDSGTFEPSEGSQPPGDNTAGPSEGSQPPGDNTAGPSEGTQSPGGNTAGSSEGTQPPGDNTAGSLEGTQTPDGSVPGTPGDMQTREQGGRPEFSDTGQQASLTGREQVQVGDAQPATDGGRPNGMQNHGTETPADDSASTVPPEALPLVSVSVLFLLAGLLFALKVK